MSVPIIKKTLAEKTEEFFGNFNAALEHVENEINESKENLDSLIEELALTTIDTFFQTDIEDYVICCTGYGPFKESNLDELLKKLGAKLDNSQTPWDEVDYIIIGRDGFDENYLRQAVKQDADIVFISQEDFINLLLFGEFEEYSRDDKRVLNHEGLSFLSSIGFQWPSTDYDDSDDDEEDFSTGELAEVSEIKEQYGYHVQAGNTLYNRQNSLRRAVNGIGLKKVANHIAFLIHMNQRRNDSKMSHAVKCWREDLEWLKREFYQKGGGRFIWPRV